MTLDLRAESAPMRFALVLGGIAWVVAPLLLVAVLTYVSSAISVEGEQASTWAAVEEVHGEGNRSVLVQLEWSEPPPVVAPSWSGTVTDVLVGEGSVVRSGDTVVEIDGCQRIVWHSDKPFYRQLKLGDQGEDVAALNEMLAALSFDHSADDKFSSLTRRGVKTLETKLGLTNTGVFEPNWIVFMPADAVTVSDVEAVVGAPAPAAGTPLLQLVPVLVAAKIGEFSEAPVISEFVASEDESLFVGTAEIEISEDRQHISSSGLDVLERLVDGGVASIAGSLVQHVDPSAVAVPAAAVKTRSDGTTFVCLQRHSASTESTAVTEAIVTSVEIIGGSAGRSILVGDLEVGDAVMVGGAFGQETCG